METSSKGVTAGLPEGENRAARTRRGFIAALVTALGSALLIGLLWLISRGAPSAQRDPHLTPPAIP